MASQLISILITNRTAADVDLYKRLKLIGFQNFTVQEKLQWHFFTNGAYNTSDLNRVGEAQTYLIALLKEYGFAVPSGLSPNEEWIEYDSVTPENMAEYLSITAAIRDSMPGLQFGEIPSTMENLTYIGANQIEELLLQVEKYILAIPVSYIYSGEAFAGEF